MSTEIFDPVTQRAEWLAERRTYIGATDVAKILNVHPYGTAHDVWLDKHGKLVIEENTAMWLGTEMEPIIAKHFGLRYGVEVRPSHVYRHPKFTFCCCNPDREIEWEGMPALLECKMAGHWSAFQFGDLGSDAIPEHYLCQVLWQLIITRVKVVVLYVLLDNREFKPYIYTLDPDLSTIAHVFPREDVTQVFSKVVAWWNKHIVEGVEPEMTGRPQDTEWLQKTRSSYDNGLRTNADEETDHLCHLLEALLKAERDSKLAADECKNKIKKFMSERGADTLDWGAPDENPKDPFTWKTDSRGIASFRTPFKTGRA